MDLLVSILVFSVGLVAFAVLTNQLRARREFSFELKPNCLLTRWPLLFVTGPRSLFYFKTYWNSYPAFLAEHGYEVFTLHLPWNNPQQRLERFQHFLEQQEEHGRHFHLIMDNATFSEFEPFLRAQRSSTLRSLTEISEHSSHSTALSALPLPYAEVECPEQGRLPLSLKIAYAFHRRLCGRKNLPGLSALGASFDTAIFHGLKLLERAQTLAEMDLREEV